MTGLSDKAMLVTLNLRQWSAAKQDKRASAEVAINHGSDAKMGRYVKYLVPKKALEPVRQAYGQIYLEHRRRTLPWLDDGTRVLASAGYFDYMSWLRAAQTELDDLLTQFYADYPAHIQEAQRRLNGLFDLSDYPPPSRIHEQFGVDLKVRGLPTAGDFRVELDSSEVERIRASIERDLNEGLSLAFQDAWSRVENVLTTLVCKLSAYDGGREGAFRDSLVGNVKELAEVLPGLNLWDDQGLTWVTGQLDKLGRLDPDALRKDEGHRSDVAKEAQSILDQMSAFVSA